MSHFRRLISLCPSKKLMVLILIIIGNSLHTLCGQRYFNVKAADICSYLCRNFEILIRSRRFSSEEYLIILLHEIERNSFSGTKYSLVYMYCGRHYNHIQRLSPIVHFFRLLAPRWSIGLTSQFLDYFTDGRTPCTGDQLVTRPLPKQRTI
jgi:hypothetical protein